MNVLGRIKSHCWVGSKNNPCAPVMHKHVVAGKTLCSSQAFENHRKSMVAVQQLYDVCKATFPLSTSPSLQSLQQVRRVLEGVTPTDVGLEAENAGEQDRGFGFFGLNGRRGRHSAASPRWAPPISYLHLYENDDFSMGIFCLPTSAVIPLHNHPGMTVLSKLLYGSLHIRAYDWVNPDDEKLNADPSQRRLANLAVDKVLSAPCDVAVLFPNSGNIHAFTAITPCAVLDVLAPPYSIESGRHCTYYRETPNTPGTPSGRGEGSPSRVQAGGEMDTDTDTTSAWLQEYQPPDDFVVQRGTYRGPRVVPQP